MIPEDCVASNDLSLHNATLKNVELLLRDVTTSEELLKMLRQDLIKNREAIRYAGAQNI